MPTGQTSLGWFALLWALFCFVMCRSDTADPPGYELVVPADGCGDLAGSCNAQVCCCSNGGFLTRTPDGDTCKSEPSSSVVGTVFLVIAGLIPALSSWLLFRFTTPLQMISTSNLLSQGENWQTSARKR